MCLYTQVRRMCLRLCELETFIHKYTGAADVWIALELETSVQARLERLMGCSW